MAREFFKNLPNTTTPLTAPRLNGFLDGDEAMGNVVVDSIKSKNMFNKNNALIKKFVNKESGDISNSDDWSATDFIEIEPNTSYIFSGVTNSLSSIAGTAFYNSSKVFISGIDSTTYNFTTPANAKYVRVSLNTETPTQVQLEKGNTATNYAPYQELNIDCASGSFTPTIFGDTTAGTATYNLQEGHYTKIGKIVHFEIRIGCTLTGSSGLLLIGGLPNLGTYYEPAALNVISTLVNTVGQSLCTRIYGNNLLLSKYDLGNVSDLNWSSTNYIYISGTMLLM